MGSSPPVRGAPPTGLIPQPPTGLIPARAGSTLVLGHSMLCVRAHPRPCGEHRISQCLGRVNKGSSPPVRGAPPPFFGQARSLGLIPARAGSTVSSGNRTVRGGLIPARAGSTGAGHPARNRHRAHPRPCGEHIVKAAIQLAPAGSSPPVRGAPGKISGIIASIGLIPARAGSTL